jgi:hypothetical protein
MNAVARMALLDFRTIAPYRTQGLALFAIAVVIDIRSPVVIVPAIVLLTTTQIAAYPFHVADKAGLETLYAVLPLSRRSVLLGHYVWAMACFLATATVGTTVALLLAQAQHVPFGGRTLATVLTLSWMLFAVNVSIQFPLLVRFGYSQISVLGTMLPLALVSVAVVRLHLTVPWIQAWLPLLGVAGIVAVVGSVAVAIAVARQRLRY